MKKTAISGLTVIILSWIINTSHAQFGPSFAHNNLSTPDPVKYFKDPNTKAERNFIKTYKNATDILWYTLHDGRLMVRFFDNDVQTKIFYNRKGSNVAMIRYYTEDKLPNEVRHLVKGTYYDFNIFLVIEVTVGHQTAYQVKIEDEVCTKTIRVMNGEMDVIEEIEKL
jgi:hypothetical protein